MVKPLYSFTGCQVKTLRDAEFSWTGIQKQRNLNSRSSAQYAYKLYLKNYGFETKKSSARPQNCQKMQKQFVNDVLKDHKTSRACQRYS